ncbi:hypothetical protein EVAR_17207_1 [Eumeta japonica]|uniref:Uncharacterized protein n=1 Tax=Eumeta variegata TaxID=151549 RepID=A0A4C1U8U0_EUMVA|nr:hypothetical protein EVAR_17207_1 [Eumeta japonica]
MSTPAKMIAILNNILFLAPLSSSSLYMALEIQSLGRKPQVERFELQARFKDWIFEIYSVSTFERQTSLQVTRVDAERRPRTLAILEEPAMPRPNL